MRKAADYEVLTYLRSSPTSLYGRPLHPLGNPGLGVKAYGLCVSVVDFIRGEPFTLPISGIGSILPIDLSRPRDTVEANR
jgi:hypothetical protein